MAIMLTRVLTIAGFDPSAGAGILADIKAFEHCKVYGQAVCTALTIQNENILLKPNWLPWWQIKEQLEILSKTYNFGYIKIGLVENPQTLEKIFKWLRKKYPKAFILWDPILKASTGFEFHRQKAITWQKLLSYVDLLTPNLPEAEFLGITDGSPKTAVLVKGGHLASVLRCTDTLFMPHSPTPVKFTAKRIKNVERHGSGCTLSALILANLALGNSLQTAIGKAKKSMRKFFENGDGKLGVLAGVHKYSNF
jgi:hydroxymethylpyrimidine/phosphomethylpyrimidine kinase